MPLPKAGDVFTHFEGGRYKVTKVDMRLRNAIWYQPHILDGDPPHPKSGVPGSISCCTPENWPIICGEVPPPKVV